MPAADIIGLALLAVVIVVIVSAGPNLLRRFDERAILSRRLQIIDLYAQGPNGFEGLVEGIFHRLGYTTLVRARGEGHADGGIDLKLRGPDGKTVLVQCKNWLTWRVGVDPVRALYGVVAKSGAAEGIVVTSGSFSGTARRWASSIPPDRPRLGLVDGKELLRLASQPKPTQPPTTRTRTYEVLDRIDRWIPFGSIVDWVDAEFQNRPIWVPIVAAVTVGLLFAILRQPRLAITYALLILVVGGLSRGWRWWQGRLLHRITSVEDLRRNTLTRGRFQYAIAEACQRQGYFVREFKPAGVDLYCLEARAGKERTLIQVLSRGSSRVTVDEVRALEELRAKHRFQEAVLLTAGIVPSETLMYAASTNVQALGGRELVDFLSRERLRESTDN